MLPIPTDHLLNVLLQQVPSVSFIQTGLAAILATGRTTALVVDVGHLETTVLPVSLNQAGILVCLDFRSRNADEPCYFLHIVRYLPSVLFILI